MKNKSELKPLLSDILIYLLLIMILLLFVINAIKINTKQTEEEVKTPLPIIRLEPYIEKEPTRSENKQINIINNDKNTTISTLSPLFKIIFGEDKKQIGKLNYDPGASNGISGGAIPTDIKINNNEILIADGYGPRIVRYSMSGEYLGDIDLKELRPDELKDYKALCGFKFDVDNLNNIYVLDSEKAVIWIYNKDKLLRKIDIKNILKEYSILDVHPYLMISNNGYIFLKLTVSLNDKDNYGYDYIPVNKSKIIGAILTNNGNYIASYDPDLNFISLKDVFYTISSTDEKGFNISGYKLEDNRLIEKMKLIIDDPEWEYGDLINSSNENNIYYLSKNNGISEINLISETRKSIILPDLKYHPITVSKDGIIAFLDINYSEIEVYVLKQ